MTTGWDAENCSHLNEHERRVAATMLKVSPADVLGPPKGLLVGEMPGPNTRGYMPLFPHPPNSSGGRLMKMANLTVGQYIGRLRRVNVFLEYRERWDSVAAVERAAEIVDGCGTGTNIVLLGKKVGRAFGFDEYFQTVKYMDLAFTLIPHPSGLNRAYNEPNIRRAAQMAIRWAAGELFKDIPAPQQDNKEIPDGST